MPTFQYVALDAAGRRVAGELAAPSEQSVFAELESRRLAAVSVAPKTRARALGRGVSARALGATYQQLSDLLRAGVPLLRSLKLLGGRKSNPRLSSVFRDLSEGVAQGEDLAEAMSRRPEVFPEVHIAMVRAAEKGGFLELVFQRLGQLVIGQAELRATVIGNLIYPSVLVVVGTSALGLIFGVFVPKFREAFASLKDNLPAITQLVLWISDALTRYAPYTAVVLALAAAGAWWAWRRPAVRSAVEQFRTLAPVIGPLTRSLAAGRFCRMLGTMLASGVPMLSALGTAKKAAGNGLMEAAIERAAESVKAGQPLSGPLGESGLFEDDVVEMISVGESANNLDSVLITIADTTETRVQRRLTTAVRLIEPLLILLLALMVVLVAVALILPMTRLSANIG